MFYSGVFYAIGQLMRIAASLYLLVMLVRMVIDWAQVLVANFKPRGVILLVANLVYALTDPPIRAFRKVVPPLRLGSGLALDLGFLIVFFIVVLISRIGTFIAFAF